MNGQVVQFHKKTVRERLDEAESDLRKMVLACIQNEQVTRMRVKTIEEKLGIVFPPVEEPKS